MTPIYAAKDLKKFYGNKLALDLDYFSLAKGELLILKGPNGGGKSTFLRLLAFLEKPTSGSLTFFGSAEPRRECTLLLQEPWLMRSSVYANVILGLKLRGIKENLHERYREAMRSAGFANPEDFEKRPSSSLSGGEKQRVALAARLILNPSVLLLDEPTAHVDYKSERHIINALLSAHEAGTTIVCATHDNSFDSIPSARLMLMNQPL